MLASHVMDVINGYSNGAICGGDGGVPLTGIVLDDGLSDSRARHMAPRVSSSVSFALNFDGELSPCTWSPCKGPAPPRGSRWGTPSDLLVRYDQ